MTVWIGTSWKMTKTIGEARAYTAVLADASFPDGVQPFVLPAHTSLAAVRSALPLGSPVMVGAQNAHWAQEGAGTGEVSMRMVADAGATLVEIGHSERREQFGETDESVARKARAALDAGLVPLICVGEPASVRDSGGAEDFVRAQVRAALDRLTADELHAVVVAYEPVWAIGERGRPATRTEISPAMAAIVEEVAAVSGGRSVRALLYGGSVNVTNAVDLLEDPYTDGLFVGRAAWDVEGFLALVGVGALQAARRSRA